MKDNRDLRWLIASLGVKSKEGVNDLRSPVLDALVTMYSEVLRLRKDLLSELRGDAENIDSFLLFSVLHCVGLLTAANMLMIPSCTVLIEVTVENRLIVAVPSGLMLDRDSTLVVVEVSAVSLLLLPLTVPGDTDKYKGTYMGRDRDGRFILHHLLSAAEFFALRERLYDIKVMPCWIERFMTFIDRLR